MAEPIRRVPIHSHNPNGGFGEVRYELAEGLPDGFKLTFTPDVAERGWVILPLDSTIEALIYLDRYSKSGFGR